MKLLFHCSYEIVGSQDQIIGRGDTSEVLDLSDVSMWGVSIKAVRADILADVRKVDPTVKTVVFISVHTQEWRY